MGIKEDGRNWSSLILLAIFTIILLPLFVSRGIFDPHAYLLLIFFWFIFGRRFWKGNFLPHDYVMERKIDKLQSDLKPYEAKLLSILFNDKDSCSTKKLRRRSKILSQEMQKLRKKLYKETETNTEAYEIGLGTEIRRNAVLIVGISILVFVMIASQAF